jgi:hypothetical protein
MTSVVSAHRQRCRLLPPSLALIDRSIENLPLSLALIVRGIGELPLSLALIVDGIAVLPWTIAVNVEAPIYPRIRLLVNRPRLPAGPRRR